MILLPAIDMIAGKPVRLYQGDYTKKEIVVDSILATAEHFAREGAEYIHMVDLDGAKSGKRENASFVIEAAKRVNVPIEIGGGIRTMEDISYYLEHGVTRVILGTAAIRDEELLKKAIDQYGAKIAVGMDCKHGYAMAEGWLEKSELYYIDFAKHLEAMGVANIIFTDISKDGTMHGPNLEMLKALKEAVKIDITASGGIRDLTNIQDLAALNLYGAITGKAVYAGTLDLKEAMQAGRRRTC